ncbi:hypothetical protein [Brevibacillus laterosporus]|uniref:hypothetical protein n=1 Tax=Brevibacillus laterosporus TaxID=1465 RepID=UPI0018F88166|nr:hypothetical protein [Brevibacillus laterosporus]MBG9776107.1 hypothetical protein [Brevibacillus laterosporus]
MNEYKLFKVNEEYPEFIVAQTAVEALNCHNEGTDTPIGMDEVEEVSMNYTGMFEQENGTRKEMTFGEYLGEDFKYVGAQCIAFVG